jgi:transcription elongation factor GreB
VSRAFIQESDDSFYEDDIPETKIPLPTGVKNYMTPSGAELLKSELVELKTVGRPRLAAELSRQVSGSIPSQKVDISAERRRLREIDRRINYLSQMVDRLEIVDPERQDPERVLFGASVTVLEGSAKKQTYRIVGIDESDPAKGKVSWISPVAKALISARVGDVVTLKRPGSTSKLKILKIEYEG